MGSNVVGAVWILELSSAFVRDPTQKEENVGELSSSESEVGSEIKSRTGKRLKTRKGVITRSKCRSERSCGS